MAFRKATVPGRVTMPEKVRTVFAEAHNKQRRRLHVVVPSQKVRSVWLSGAKDCAVQFQKPTMPHTFGRSLLKHRTKKNVASTLPNLAKARMAWKKELLQDKVDPPCEALMGGN